MLHDKYILKDGKPVPENDVLKWSRWFEDSDQARIVARINFGNIGVSTVFLGLDRSFGGEEPVLWETMIFGGEHDGYQRRYTSREEALAGHDEAVEMVVKR